MKKDEGGMVRKFPGPHGPMVSRNPDLGSGPYSQNNGLPLGGKSVSEWRKKHKKKRKQKAKEYGKIISELAFAYLKIAKDIYEKHLLSYKDIVDNDFFTTALKKTLEELDIKIIPRGEDDIGRLGHGAFGTVFEGLYKGIHCAIKIVKINPEQEVVKYSKIKDIYDSLPKEISKHLPNVYLAKVLTIDNDGQRDDISRPYGIIIIEYLQPLPVGLETIFGKVFNKTKPYIVKQITQLINQHLDKIVYEIIYKNVKDNPDVEYNKIVNNKDYQNLKDYYYNLENIDDFSELMNYFKSILRHIITYSDNYYDILFGIIQNITGLIRKNINLGRFPIDYTEDKDSENIKFDSIQVEELYEALKWLKDQNIVKWKDVHGGNVLVRPSTGDLVVADVGMFVWPKN